jgi:hypothetical protein
MIPEHYIIMILIGVACFFGGVGGSDINVAGKVDVHENKLCQIQKDFEDERKRTDERVFSVIKLVEKSMEQNAMVIEQNTKLLAHLEIRRSED